MKKPIFALLFVAMCVCGCGSKSSPGQDSQVTDPNSGGPSNAPADGTTGDSPTPPQAPPSNACAQANPQRNVYFGDLHVHTSYSWDAYTFGTRTDPFGAYRYAKGSPIVTAGNNIAQIDRPLDFTAVTDHAEGFATNVGSYRDANVAWKNIQQAANEANDSTTACSFTALIGYEWTALKGQYWLHRNVIFRNSTVPDLPISSADQSVPAGLWGALMNACNGKGNGCDSMSIPHNGNFSGGLMYQVPDDITAADAKLRAQFETVTEIAQHKGVSECKPGVETADPFCEFEQHFTTNCNVTPNDPTCSPNNFVRNALRRGLVVQSKIGVNPLKLGIIGATDTHNATPGGVAQYNFVGAHGNFDATPATRLKSGQDGTGALVAVWATQNRRDDIFDALRRRETFATSGPRIKVRFFGGWDFPSDLCSTGNLVSTGYASGVPMGGDLPPKPAAAKAPSFAVWALKDPGVANHPGTDLQRIQIVKGWVNANGQSAEQVFDIAGGDTGASVDPKTCQPQGSGHDQLCTVWTDPMFDSTQNAFYYVRVLENPSCRYTQYDCNGFAPGTAPLACLNPAIAKTAQERAWTSPIWYSTH